jgi:hypothetical protein
VKEKEEVEMEAEYAHLLIFSGTRRYSLEEESGLFNFQVFIRRFRIRRDPIGSDTSGGTLECCHNPVVKT